METTLSERLEIMRDIAEWFQKYGWMPFFNQKNPDNYSVFHGNTNRKPDILLTKWNYNVLVETKKGKEHKDLLDGFDQVLEYAGEYYTGRVNYFFSRGRSINVNAFVLATKYSRSGYLYANESKVNELDYGYLKESNHMLEKPVTHTFTRLLWRQWEKGIAFDYYEDLRRGRANKSLVLPRKPFVGVVVAKIGADNRQVYDFPYLYLNSNWFVNAGYNKIHVFEGQQI